MSNQRANYNKQISDTSIRIGEVRFSYAYVINPRVNPTDGTSKYSVQILVPKTDALAKQLLDHAIEAAVQNGIATKFGGKRPVPAKLKLPLRDGDEEFPDDPVYAGMWFFNATSATDRRPGVRVLELGQLVEPLDAEDFYSGCWGAAVVNFFPYAVSGNMGVAAGLNNIIKTRDDDRLGGGSHSPEADFNDLIAGGSVLD